MRLLIRVLILGMLWLQPWAVVYGQAATAPPSQNGSPQADASRLPEALREKAEALLKETSEPARARMATELARANPSAARDFLLAVMSKESSPLVRRAIVDGLGRYTDAGVQQALEQAAVSDPDAGVALLALERLRAQRNQQMRALLNRRIELARQNRDEAGLKQLAAEQERWVTLVRGTTLPAFARAVPPTFSLKPTDKSVRVLAFGDYGTGLPAQKQTAEAMLNYHRKTPFDFGITLGDNFYPVGLASPTDPRWKTLWEDLYTPLGIKFYATLGNHDWGAPDSPLAEILYSQQSKSWSLPAPYYTFTAGPVQFFALDTNDVSEAQLIWLDEELRKSKARWKLVYGHHPIYNVGSHGDSPVLIAKLLPLLKGRADLYLVGHDHNLQHLKPEGGLHFFVSGAAGAGLYPVKQEARALFAKSINGFAVIEADESELKVQFIGTDQARLYEFTMKKDE